MAFSKTHDETAPIDHTTFTSQPGAVRDTKISFRERLAFGGVYFPSTHDELAGEHSYVRLANQSSFPAAVAGKWHLLVKSTGLFIQTPAGVEIQITDASAISGSSFVTGDWIISTVSTAHSGWTNVSSTYTDKFMRINATPLTTGGSNAHTHTPGTFAGPSHTHSVSITSGNEALGGVGSPNIGGGTNVHTHQVSGNTGADGTGAVTGTSASSDNIPAYVQVVIFQKD